MIRDILRFLWKRDSESTIILFIVTHKYLDDRDLQETISFLKAVQENRQVEHDVHERKLE